MLVLKRRVGEWIVVDDFLYVEIVGYDQRAGQVHVKVVEWYEDGSFSADVVYKLKMNNRNSYADIGRDFELEGDVLMYAGYPDFKNFEIGIEAPREMGIGRLEEFPEYREYQKSSGYVDEYGMFGRTTRGTKESFGWSSYGDVTDEDFDAIEGSDDEGVMVSGGDASKHASDVSWFFQ